MSKKKKQTREIVEFSLPTSERFRVLSNDNEYKYRKEQISKFVEDKVFYYENSLFTNDYSSFETNIRKDHDESYMLDFLTHNSLDKLLLLGNKQSSNSSVETCERYKKCLSNSDKQQTFPYSLSYERNKRSSESQYDYCNQYVEGFLVRPTSYYSQDLKNNSSPRYIPWSWTGWYGFKHDIDHRDFNPNSYSHSFDRDIIPFGGFPFINEWFLYGVVIPKPLVDEVRKRNGFKGPVLPFLEISNYDGLELNQEIISDFGLSEDDINTLPIDFNIVERYINTLPVSSIKNII
jgi:hypothetical protein